LDQGWKHITLSRLSFLSNFFLTDDDSPLRTPNVDTQSIPRDKILYRYIYIYLCIYIIRRKYILRFLLKSDASLVKYMFPCAITQRKIVLSGCGVNFHVSFNYSFVEQQHVPAFYFYFVRSVETWQTSPSVQLASLR